MIRKCSSILAILLCVAMISSIAIAQLEISRHVIASGGGSVSAGPWELQSTIGQPAAGEGGDGPITLSSGFWFPLDPGDCDSDGGVGLTDYSEFRTCLSGPTGGSSGGCECFDLDVDADNDLLDFSELQTAFTP